MEHYLIKKEEKLRIIDAKLAKLSLSGQNVLAETQAYELHIREKKLRGLPESLIEMAKSIAEKNERKDGLLLLIIQCIFLYKIFRGKRT